MARVVDVSNSPSFGDAAAAQEAAVGERHHVALSVVGTERVSGYFQPKIAPEKLIKDLQSYTPWSTRRSFFEVLKKLADISFDGKKVGLPDALSKASCV
jgi:hypothetical protein